MIPSSHMNELPLCDKIVDKTTPEAVGDILREGFDFRIVKDDSEEFWAGGDPIENRVNLKIEFRRVVEAFLG